ncbi:HEPN-associated N-terminal domain-containing protein [Dokdonella immobilis]|uniref:RES domain-containing protein n=1 Tax=Dokdonella immobilis TaxID=578942 RepID=A0A1I5AX47_9GAMM|nr:HEPN-associated N-terminal domain-containing protein [Dokdonella immobilis]SFN67086.1 RES domain-containing protein [Dokdonella immobilis]
MDRVCWKCFEGSFDIEEFIRANGTVSRCDFCRTTRIRTISVEHLVEFLREAFEKAYGSAVEDLPYDSAEGGYQGTTWSTAELLLDHVDFPRDERNKLFLRLVGEIGDDTWCEYDWTSLEVDQALLIGWEHFCEAIKHHRRFFFQEFGVDADDHDSISPARMLDVILRWVHELKLIRTLKSGEIVYRARASSKMAPFTTAQELGPPPVEAALQANRMNPIGIPMFYVADRKETAIAETPGNELSLGHFRILKDLRVVDLAKLPPVPGFFSSESREKRQTIQFLYKFRDAIEQPVARDNAAHLDYLPSQVVTEYVRERGVHGMVIDGVCYRSAKISGALNYVFFATSANVVPKAKSKWYELPQDLWFKLTKSETKKIRNRGS